MRNCTRIMVSISAVGIWIGWLSSALFSAVERPIAAGASSSPQVQKVPLKASPLSGGTLSPAAFGDSSDRLLNMPQFGRDYLPAPSQPRPVPIAVPFAASTLTGGVRVTYVSFDGVSYELTQFSGKHVAVLFPDDWLGTGEDQFDQNMVDRFVDRTDILYENFAEIVGQEPRPSDVLLTIAMVPTSDTGYGGRGHLGYKGIEIDPVLRLRQWLLRSARLDKNTGLISHEMAHNFDVYSYYLQYLQDGVHAWTSFIDSYTLVYSRGGFESYSPQDLTRQGMDAFYDYLDDPALDWETCLLNAECWNPNSVWAGSLWRIAELHGPAAVRAYMRYVRDYVASHPTFPPDAHAKNDLHVAAMAAGAGYDLSCYVDAWRWEASPELRQEMSLLYPSSPYCADSDGDGASPAVGDCDDTNDATHRGAAEVADGQDNDCNGTVDDLRVVEPAGGDFPNPKPIGLPSVVSGRIGPGDSDFFTFALAQPASVEIELCSTPDFRGWVFVYDEHGAWFGYQYVGHGCSRRWYQLPRAGAWRFGVELNAESSPGAYEVHIRPAAPWPAPSWAGIWSSQEDQGSFRLTAAAHPPADLSPVPDAVRFWASGLGVVGTVPYSATSNLLWQPPQGTAIGDVRIRAQALNGGIPVTDFTPPASAAPSCVEDADSLCLNHDRFRVDVTWRNYAGQTGVGKAVPFRSDSGLFWFFGPSNLEMLIKVIDGCSLNDRFWVYAAATTDVEYRLSVTDTVADQTHEYTNTLGTRSPAITDSSAFATCGAALGESQPLPVAREDLDLFAGALAQAAPVPSEVAPLASTLAPESTETGCTPGDHDLCLRNNRFRVGVTWRDYSDRTGSGSAVPYTNDSGMFWFFGPDNIEFLVKVINGCSLNSTYWVYAAATTDVEYTMTVTDTSTNTTKTYSNPLGAASPAITDSSAFETCP